MPPPPDPAVLRGMPLFAGLDAGALADAVALARPRLHARGTAVFTQGEPAAAGHALIDGRVKIVQIGPDGQQVVMRFIGPGEMFGTLAIFTDGLYPADAVAVADLRAIPPYQRHQLIFQSMQDLTPGDGFSLVNDHDPRPLHHQLLSLFGAGFSWEYLQQGPEVWQVRIARPERAAATSLRVCIDRNGDVAVAADARLGPDGSGGSVCEVTDIPGTPEADVLALLQGVVPPAGWPGARR